MSIDYIQTFNSWLFFAGLSMATVSFIITFVYLLGTIISNDKLKGWAKLELVEIFYSAILIGLALATVPTVDGLVQGALGVSNIGGTQPVAGSGGFACGTGSITSTFIRGANGNYQCYDICGPTLASITNSVYSGIPSCHMKLSIWYLRELYDEAKLAAFDLYLDNIKTTMFAEFSLNIEFIFELAGFMTFNPWKGFLAIGNSIKSLAFDWYIKILMINKFQEVFLRFIANALFPVLFVMGAMLRAFSFTRKLGGLLLGLALSLYFVYPAFYSFGALIILDLKNSIRSDPYLNPDRLPDPPIANSMFLTGNLILLGGNLSPTEARQHLYTLEGRSSFTLEGVTYEEYQQLLDRNRAAYSPTFDFSSSRPSSMSDTDKVAALFRMREIVDQWYSEASKRSRFDNFVSTTWSKNGVLESVARLTFWSLFFSLFGMLATIASTRSLAIIFGGDVEIAGLTRLI